LRGDTFVLLAQQREQNVLGTDMGMAGLAGLVLGEHDHLAGLLGKPLEHGESIAGDDALLAG
jgi:hypothetical protein